MSETQPFFVNRAGAYVFARLKGVSVDQGKVLVRTAVLWAGLVLATMSCDSPTDPGHGHDDRPDVRQWVGGAAAEALDSRGRFVLPSPDVPPGDGLTAATRAGELASAAVRSHLDAPPIPDVQSIIGFMEERHGAPIEWERTRTGHPVAYLAESPYHPLPDSLFFGFRRLAGSYHVVGLYVPGYQVGSVAVSTLSQDYAVDEHGRLLWPPSLEDQSRTFRFQGVRYGVQHHFPLHPEQAVHAVGSQTGVRVVEVPLLLQPPRVWPQGALWKLVLERELELVRTDGGGSIESRDIHVGMSQAGNWIWAVPDSEQPASDTIRYGIAEPGPCPGEVTEYELVLHVRADRPVRYVQVVPPGG